jgi:hypothetical protein
MHLRSLTIRDWDMLLNCFDSVVTPTGAANLPQLTATNATGFQLKHPPLFA